MVAPGRHPHRAADHRGQTAFDFLVGMTVFLVSITFVISFVPGMFHPFETDTGPNMVAADRSAATLAESTLVEDVGVPNVLNETCTAEFFGEDGDTGSCDFEVDASELTDALDVDGSDGVNVTIEDGSGISTIDGPDGPVTAASGKEPPSTADVVVARRVVLLDDQRGTLYVRLW